MAKCGEQLPSWTARMMPKLVLNDAVLDFQSTHKRMRILNHKSKCITRCILTCLPFRSRET